MAIQLIQNGLSPTACTFGEADAVRWIFFLACYTAVLGCVLRARAWVEGPRDAALPG